MAVTKESLISELRRAVPQFKIDETYAEGGLGFPIINDFARYIVGQCDWGDEEELRTSLAFLERCVLEGDPYVCDLARECIESLRGPHAQNIRSIAGKHTLAVWDQNLRP